MLLDCFFFAAIGLEPVSFIAVRSGLIVKNGIKMPRMALTMVEIWWHAQAFAKMALPFKRRP